MELPKPITEKGINGFRALTYLKVLEVHYFSSLKYDNGKTPFVNRKLPLKIFENH